jgi:hypothetical protein
MSYSENIVSVNKVVYSSEINYVSGFRYAVTDFVINDHISFRVLLLDQKQQPLEVKSVTMGGTDYAKWGNDDSYLMNFITGQVGLSLISEASSSVDAPSVPAPSVVAPIQAVDTNNKTVLFVNLIYNQDGTILLPDGYTRDANNNQVLDNNGNPITYEFMKYSNEGIPITFGSLSLDANNNPVLPFGAAIDANGLARDAQGEHIVMVTTSS